MACHAHTCTLMRTAHNSAPAAVVNQYNTIFQFIQITKFDFSNHCKLTFSISPIHRNCCYDSDYLTNRLTFVLRIPYKGA